MDMNEELLIQMALMSNPELRPLIEMLLRSREQAPLIDKPKKKKTAYQRRYKAAFKKVSSRYKLKSGKWKKNGFRLAVKEAHRLARRGGKK